MEVKCKKVYYCPNENDTSCGGYEKNPILRWMRCVHFDSQTTLCTSESAINCAEHKEQEDLRKGWAVCHERLVKVCLGMVAIYADPKTYQEGYNLAQKILKELKGGGDAQ